MHTEHAIETPLGTRASILVFAHPKVLLFYCKQASKVHVLCVFRLTSLLSAAGCWVLQYSTAP